MRIDVWTDILCPFCHLGRRHLALALERFEHADEVEVTWHSFQLDRTAPAVDDRVIVEAVAAKYGTTTEQATASQKAIAAQAAAVGLDYQWAKAVGGNSFDAHRVIHLARERGVEQAVTDRIMRAWFSEGVAIGDRDELVRLASEAGLDADEVAQMLAGDDYGTQVRTDEALAAQIGITAVPMFVLDQKFGVSGAQPVDVLVQALEHTWADRGNAPVQAEQSGGCGGACGCGGGGADEAGDGAARDGAAYGSPDSAGGTGCGCGAGGCGGGGHADADAQGAGGMCGTHAAH